MNSNLPWNAACTASLAARGRSRFVAFVAPSKGGTSDHRLVTVPELPLVRILSALQAIVRSIATDNNIAIAFLFMVFPSRINVRRSMCLWYHRYRSSGGDLEQVPKQGAYNSL